MTTRQHDHHVRMVACGLNWRIVGVRHPLLFLACPNGCCQATVDAGGVDYGTYCEEAVMLDAANALREERGLPVDARSSTRH